MKKCLKHFPFITAIILFLIEVSDVDDKTNFLNPFNEASQYFFTTTFLIMFSFGKIITLQKKIVLNGKTANYTLFKPRVLCHSKNKLFYK